MKQSLAFASIFLLLPTLAVSSLSETFVLQDRNDNPRIGLPKSIAQIRGAREEVEVYVLEIKQKVPTDSPTYMKAADLYNSAFSKYDGWVAALKTAIAAGSINNLRKDEDYQEVARDAGRSSEAFLKYVKHQLGYDQEVRPGSFTDASAREGQNLDKVIGILNKLATVGIDIWKKYKERSPQQRLEDAKNFEQETKWRKWNAIVDETKEEPKTKSPPSIPIKREFSSANNALGSQQLQLYKVTLVQAAPGKLLDLIDLYKARAAELKTAGDETPLWMRHSQGDHWDLMVLFPVGSYSEYYQHERITKRLQAQQAAKLDEKFKEQIAWQEDLFAYGPPLADLRKAFANGAFFHVEMFVALPGKFAELYKEREMENAYSRSLKQPENFIFVRDQGATWDIFTIGVFRDLKHYAESADALPKDQEAAAKAAGFEAPSQIGPYLRRFIREHHDTLAVAVK